MIKYSRIIIAFLLTISLLYITYINSEGRPKLYTHTENGFTFEMTSVPKGTEFTTVEITLNIIPPDGKDKIDSNLTVYYNSTKFGQDITTPLYKYRSIKMNLKDSLTNLYSITQSIGKKGKRAYYYFQIRDNIGSVRASFKMPEGKPFLLKFIGEVPSFVLISHIFLIFATVFFVMLGTVHSFHVITSGNGLSSMAKHFLIANILLFISCYPIGFAMNWYAFDCFWEGVPFGTDATDNKTQIVFVYLLLVNFLTIASITKGKIGKNIFSPKTRGWFGIVSCLIMLTMYLIPHSIQFAPSDTYLFCYSLIGLAILIYLYGLFFGKKYPYNSKS
ncbi:MAG: hypothetical protein DRP35_06255 [Candidatus Zixiibacteriota bacterium]|nr:MAG: hypothetical protein DRP35_06255 [candidate division Zixibacteria bacterium]